MVLVLKNKLNSWPINRGMMLMVMVIRLRLVNDLRIEMFLINES